MLRVVNRATKSERRNRFLIIVRVLLLLDIVVIIVAIDFIVAIGVIDFFSRRGRPRQSPINPDFYVNTC